MKIEEIRAFDAICKYGTFTKAAEALYTTQPTISWQIASLEKEFGRPLLIRGKGIHTVQLTKAGEMFRSQAEKWLRLWEETMQMMDADGMQKYTVTCVPSMSELMMPSIVQQFRREVPGCVLNLMGRTSSSAYYEVEKGDVDAAVVCSIENNNQLLVRPIAIERSVFICREDADYASSVKISDLSAGDVIPVRWTHEQKSWYRRYFDDLQKMRVLEMEAVKRVTDFFDRKNAWSIVPISVLKECRNYRVCELDTELPPRLFYMISRYPPKEPYWSVVVGAVKTAIAQGEGIELIDSQ